MELDPRETAVVLIEYQNDFTSEGGALHGAVADVMEPTEMLANTRALVDAGARGRRDHHARADHVRGGLRRDHRHPYGILKGVVDRNAFVKGTWGAEIVDELAPAGGRHRRRGQARPRHVRQHQPRLHPARKGITTIALGGFLTNCCVESTMRTGYEKGYQRHHADRLRRGHVARGARQRDQDDYPMFSHPVSSQEFLGALSGAALPDASRGYDA